MGRIHPTECEHGNIVDWGDFGPEKGPQFPVCHQCEEAIANASIYITDRSDDGRPLGRLVAVLGERLFRVELAPHLELVSKVIAS